MHIPDGMLPGEVCLAGFAGTAALTWISVKQAEKKYRDTSRVISRASVMAAAFFVASWIHIPLPPVSVHPILAGLMGIVLGWLSFPAILVALFFQAAMFGHGGFTTLGVNSLTMGGSALLAWGIFRAFPRGSGDKGVLQAGFLAGFAGVMLAAAATSAILLLTIPSYVDPSIERAGILAMAGSHIPVALAEGVFTGLVARLLMRLNPGMLEQSG
ncbi:MAG: cobalt transporter CbiM [Candidatus Fermentibacteraceae bacterium]|nr:cobalt transporter CbiM [Candidatus Fermentibacteraceae bacterium]MBN2607928.1 cobalt transporter CbiM [Candidatus Fermentibacteraceae bacterium]